MLASQTTTIRKIISETEATLEEAGIENPRREAEILLEEVTAFDRFNLYYRGNKILDNTQLIKLNQMVSLRKNNNPVQYITGKTYFRSLVLNVTPEVLIPRYETEQLVELVIKKCKRTLKKDLTIADVGTGSGAIAISLAKEIPYCKLIATDVSKKALTTAFKNASTHGVEGQITFLNTFLMNSVPRKVDIIVANLPYVPSVRLETLPEEVKKEPKIAVDGGNNGYGLIKKLIHSSVGNLKKQGSIFLEIGISQADAVANIIYSAGFKKVVVSKDFSNIDRYIIGEF